MESVDSADRDSECRTYGCTRDEFSKELSYQGVGVKAVLVAAIHRFAYLQRFFYFFLFTYLLLFTIVYFHRF